MGTLYDSRELVTVCDAWLPTLLALSHLSEAEIVWDLDRLLCRVDTQLTHPGVGPVTALAAEVFLGDAKRFVDGKALTSYVGIIPREYSSGGQTYFRSSTTGLP